MNYLHQEIVAGPKNTVIVTLDHAANVQFMTEANFQAYRNSRPFTYYGGYVTTSPFRWKPPFQGKWYLVVDLGGTAGTVKVATQVV